MLREQRGEAQGIEDELPRDRLAVPMAGQVDAAGPGEDQLDQGGEAGTELPIAVAELVESGLEEAGDLVG